MSCGTFPFTSRRSRSTTDMVSTNQDWKYVCILRCRENVIKSHHWCCSFSFFFLQRFNLKMFPNTTTFDTKQHTNSLQTTCPQSSGSCSSSFPVSTSTRDSPTDSMSSPMGAASRFRTTVGLTSALLGHTRFPTVDSPTQNTARHRSHCGFLQTSLLRSGRNWEYRAPDKLE